VDDCTETNVPQRRSNQSGGQYDAIIVGSGPNGLAAGIVLAASGAKTLILERSATIGGGARTMELTEPGFLHDVCSAVHPLGAGSPFFRRLPLEQYGLEWIHPPVLAAHPLEGGDAAALYKSVEETASNLGPDAASYQKLIGPLVDGSETLFKQLMAPLRPQLPSKALIQFGLRGIRSAEATARNRFVGPRARALFGGMGAHSVLSLDRPGTSAFALTLLAAGHAFGWPFPKGGSQSLVDALAMHYRALGGELETNMNVTSMSELPCSRSIVFDTTPRQMLDIAGERLGGLYRRQLERYKYGPGTFKIDYALSGSIPWLADACRQAGTVHVGGTLEEIAAAERAVMSGHHPSKPFVLVAQPSLFDASRAPAGKHTAWVYCHTPSGSTIDMTEPIEQQIERFAPGFQTRIITRSHMNSVEMENYNPNYIGGDISAGANNLTQLIARPAIRWDPYTTPDRQIFLCSASTPPGGGVHGMAGYHAARSVLRRLRAT
jgi:phytoene dehydrogenase-like protein